MHTSGRLRGLAVALCCLGFAHAALAEYHASERDARFGGDVCSAGSRPGDCAIAFDQDGSTLRDAGRAVLRTADGKYIAIGEVAKPGTATQIDIGLVRLLRDGRRDAGFGNDDGRVMHALGFTDVGAATLDASGRILVAGRVNVIGATMDIGIARFNADGSVDTGFGNNGLAVTNCGDDYEFPIDLAVRADGYLLLVSRYEGEAGASPAGLCMQTLHPVTGTTSGTSALSPDTPDGYVSISAIDDTRAQARYGYAVGCLADNCPWEAAIGVRVWDPGASNTDLFPLLLLGNADATPDCGVASVQLRGPLADLDDGSVVQLLRSAPDRDSATKQWSLITHRPDGTWQRSCLIDELPSDMDAAMVLPAGDGSSDLYILGNNYADDDDMQRHEGVRRLIRGSDGRYIADDSFDGGQPRAIRVRGAGGVIRFNDPAATNQRALVDPGVPGAMSPLPQLVVVGTRQYSAPPGQDQDFYVARLGDDPVLFADGLETP